MYNKYYDSIEDKKVAKHPAFWLSDKRYLDEAPSQSNDRIDEYAFYTDKFVEVIKNKKLIQLFQRLLKVGQRWSRKQ